MRLRLQTDGAAIVRSFLSDQDFSRIAEIAGSAFAFLDGGGGDASLREPWISRELVALLSREAYRTLGLSYLTADISSIRRLIDWQRRLEWHTDYHGGGTSPYDPCFNIWLPLTAVGREQPSVEFVRGSHRRCVN